MKLFKDKAGREWSVDVNGATISRVKDLTGILLTELIGGTAASAVIADPVKIMHVLYACCKPQAEAKSITEESFLTELGGDPLDEAVDALIDEVVSFFPKSRRTMAAKVVEKGKAVQAEAVRRATEKLDSLSAAQVLDLMPGSTSGNSLESSASIPAASGSET